MSYKPSGLSAMPLAEWTEHLDNAYRATHVAPKTGRWVPCRNCGKRADYMGVDTHPIYGWVTGSRFVCGSGHITYRKGMGNE
jgi:hypothetical protein